MAVHEGEGTVLKVGSTSSTEAALGQVISVSGPSMSVPEIEKTHLGSSIHEFRPGIPDMGTMTFSLLFDRADTGHALVESSVKTPAGLFWELVTSDGDIMAFEGFPTAFNMTGMEVEGNLTAEVTVRLTTKPTIT